MIRLALLAALGFVAIADAAANPARGLTATSVLADTYDAILNAEFDKVPARLAPACESVPPFCPLMNAISTWWQIALDPDDQQHDARFLRLVEEAIDDAQEWTEREPDRAEAWFARGGAYSVRAQWRVLRGHRLDAARDGKRIKQALERALVLDPELHDARFGLGLYRYYADVAPSVVRLFRWLLRLPGGNREQGLRDMLDVYERGDVMRGEAEYQLHLIYLWYEQRPHDALRLIERLESRYPRNPLFRLAEARIQDVYLHDTSASIDTLQRLVKLTAAGEINAPAIAMRDAITHLEALGARPTP